MTIETEIIRGIAVTILFISYLVLWSLRRKLLQTKEGFDPDVLDTDKRPTQLYFRFMSNLMTFALITLLILHTVGLKQVPGFYYIFEIQDSLSAVIGFLIGFAGILICLFAQIEMGTSWRVGIDKQRTTKLIVSGIFSYCRNSTYIGLFLVCLSTFFIFPTLSFLVWIVMFFHSIEFQVRLEEEYLIEAHGDEYINYCAKVKRYIPYVY